MTVKNVKLVFDRRHRATPDNPAAVEFAVPMGDGRRRIIPTGVRLCAGQWDAEASRVQFHPDAAALNRRLLAALQAANVYLHEVERRLGFRKPLTTHVARHTFATTVALANGVPIETLSRMLGHRDIHTTQIYARVLAQSVADDGAELVAKIL